ncbi:AraC-like DNA-binding protein [Vibrio crassostreae]|nr:AraC-like DNA-binding protein [Vibrio crassostreae]
MQREYIIRNHVKLELRVIPLVSAQLVKAILSGYQKVLGKTVDIEAFGLSYHIYEQNSYYFPSKPLIVFLNFLHHTLSTKQLVDFYTYIINNFAIPHYLAQCSSKPTNVRDSLQKMIEISRIQAPSAQITLEENSDIFWLKRTQVIHGLDDTPSDFVFVLFVQLWINTMLGKAVKIHKIHTPSKSLFTLGALTVTNPQTDIHYQKGFTSVGLLTSLLERETTLPNEYFENLQSRLEPIDFLDSVKHAMDSYLGTENYSIDRIAGVLGVSVRQFQYNLEAHGVTYQKLKDEVIQHNAKWLILQNQSNLSTITTQLGYSSITQFSRSIKRITGMSPRAYKQHLFNEQLGS